MAQRISDIDYFDSTVVRNIKPSGEGLVVGDNIFDLFGGYVCPLPSPPYPDIMDSYIDFVYKSEISFWRCALNHG